MALAGFLPWGASGRVERTSYELVAIAERIDVLDGTTASVIRAWYLAPAVAGSVLLATVSGRLAVARALAALLAVGGVALAVLVRRSPVLDRLGPCVTIGAAGVVVVGLVLALVERGRNDRP